MIGIYIMNTDDLEHPWQKGPTELIAHAIEHLHRGTEFDQRVAFLLLDVGMETLMKTFLLIPDYETKTELSHGKRKEAAEGNFHQLVLGGAEAAKHLIPDINPANIEYFHNIRNRIYHEGDGIKPTVENSQAYAELAVKLLNVLLEVDLSDLLYQKEIEIEKANEKQSLRNQLINKKRALQNIIDEYNDDLFLRVVETIIPRAVLPSTRRKFDKIVQKYIDFYDFDPQNERYDVSENEFAEKGEEFISEITNLVQYCTEDGSIGCESDLLDIVIRKLFQLDFIDDNKIHFFNHKEIYRHYIRSFRYTSFIHILIRICISEKGEKWYRVLDDADGIVMISDYSMDKGVNVDLCYEFKQKDVLKEMQKMIEIIDHQIQELSALAIQIEEWIEKES
jgi:hypothetical protein